MKSQMKSLSLCVYITQNGTVHNALVIDGD